MKEKEEIEAKIKETMEKLNPTVNIEDLPEDDIRRTRAYIYLVEKGILNNSKTFPIGLTRDTHIGTMKKIVGEFEILLKRLDNE